ncbi:MAG TPA: LysM peptidoglycan-binding domain-containing protein [Anaerolineales bacterium]|nr:LysM peptidoglycan-binding domain-containing protein [Anaerolineales bacterium]
MGNVRRATWRQYLLYLGANILVSTITVLIVLNLWDRRSPPELVTPTVTVDVIAHVDSAVPTLTSTMPPSPTPKTYTVRAGDTISNIAEEFDISMEELMAANRLSNPNELSVGQVLVIPELEVAVTTPTARETSYLEATSTPAAAEAQQVVINSIDGAGDLETESVRLLNTSNEVSMAGWTLDDGGGHLFTFPDFTFYSKGAVDVHTRAGTNTTIDLYWALDQAVWTPGTVINLRNAGGVLVSSFKVPAN